MGREVAKEDREKIAEYKNSQEDISEKAKEREKSSTDHLHHHMVLARSVTLFQVAIGVAAISVLTKLRHFWYTSVGFALVGLFFLIQGL